MRARSIAMTAALLSLPTLPRAATASDGRWPTWPTEIERIAAPLVSVERPSHDRDRAAAIVRLESYATPVIEPLVIEALKDPSTQVRREALRVCYLRRIAGCIEPAEATWAENGEPTLRVAALRVLALDPTPEHLAALLEALRDPGDQMRAQAAQLLGWAPLQGDAAKDARRALVSKLTDTSSLVRQRAAEALGLQGPGEGTLAIARLLEDPEPTVCIAGAEALGRIRDPRTAPALMRALELPNEAVVIAGFVDALARLPGDEVARELLQRLDDPPTGLSVFQVAEAIGDRPDPERILVDGLIDRLAEPDLMRPCLHALLMLGEPTRPSLQAALQRGLDPALELELRRLLAALSPIPEGQAAAARTFPDIRDRQGWLELLRVGDVRERIEAGAALGALAPGWLADAAQTRIEAARAVEPVRGWLVAMASAKRSIAFVDDAWMPWARVLQWARDEAQSPSDRCLALAAIGSAKARATRRLLGRELAAFADDTEPRVRACAAIVAGRLQPKAELATLMLLDTDDRVRVGAALGLAEAETVSRRVLARLHVLAHDDPSAPVRRAAAWAVKRRAEKGRTPLPAFQIVEVRRNTWVRPPRWVELDLDGTRLSLPAVGTGVVRWGMGPGLEQADPIVDDLREP